MTLGAVTAVISVLSVGIAIGKIIYELSKTLTKLSCSVETLNETLSDFVNDNEKEHDELYGGIEELRDNIKSLEIKLEKNEKN